MLFHGTGGKRRDKLFDLCKNHRNWSAREANMINIVHEVKIHTWLRKQTSRYLFSAEFEQIWTWERFQKIFLAFSAVELINTYSTNNSLITHLCSLKSSLLLKSFDGRYNDFHWCNKSRLIYIDTVKHIDGKECKKLYITVFSMPNDCICTI